MMTETPPHASGAKGRMSRSLEPHYQQSSPANPTTERLNTQPMAEIIQSLAGREVDLRLHVT
jgi:hypothetical protein